MAHCLGASRKHDSSRWKANSRERSRMHCLNTALDRLRLLMPVDPSLYHSGGVHQRLSKIETLRMAINYISALQRALSQNTELDLLTFWKLLTRGLTSQTSQLVAASLHLYSYNELPSVPTQVQPEVIDRRQSWVSRWQQSLELQTTTAQTQSLESAQWRCAHTRQHQPYAASNNNDSNFYQPDTTSSWSCGSCNVNNNNHTFYFSRPT